jgi:hypothetical protein
METICTLFATNSLYSYLRQTKVSFFKNREQEGKISPAWGLTPVRQGRVNIRKQYRRVNMLEILCTHV